MHILGRKDFGLYANLVGMSLQILKSYLGRFLHHVAEIACQSQFLAFSRHQGRFYEQHFAAHAGPCQTCYHANFRLVAYHIGNHLFRTHKLINLLGSDDLGIWFV